MAVVNFRNIEVYHFSMSMLSRYVYNYYYYYYYYYLLNCEHTFDTLVSDLEIGFEVVVARPDVVEVIVENSDAARPTTRAVSVQYINHVDGTVDVTEMFAHTPADTHPAVTRMRNDQHLADAAPHPEILRLTVRMLERRRRPEFPV